MSGFAAIIFGLYLVGMIILFSYLYTYKISSPKRRTDGILPEILREEWIPGVSSVGKSGYVKDKVGKILPFTVWISLVAGILSFGLAFVTNNVEMVFSLMIICGLGLTFSKLALIVKKRAEKYYSQVYDHIMSFQKVQAPG